MEGIQRFGDRPGTHTKNPLDSELGEVGMMVENFFKNKVLNQSFLSVIDLVIQTPEEPFNV